MPQSGYFATKDEKDEDSEVVLHIHDLYGEGEENPSSTRTEQNIITSSHHNIFSVEIGRGDGRTQDGILLVVSRASCLGIFFRKSLDYATSDLIYRINHIHFQEES